MPGADVIGLVVRQLVAQHRRHRIAVAGELGQQAFLHHDDLFLAPLPWQRR
jgi:hypothetical protein